MAELLVSMKNIVKRFGGIAVNEHIDFELVPGEVHALLGENGAGKSTLMNILAGLYRQDEGEIILHGKRAELSSPKDAINHKVGMIHQHFKLVENLTAAENIILGINQGMFLSRKKVNEKILQFSQGYGLTIDPKDTVAHMSVGEKQRVEILKALYRGADILILDEPTAVLTPQETKELFQIIKRMTAQGCGVVIITHKMQEVMEIADRITVLRKGKKIGTVQKSDVNEQQLTEMMVGEHIGKTRKKEPRRDNETVLEIEGITVKNDKGMIAVKGASFQVKKGEILGIAGISGNGQKELAEAIAGLRAIDEGTIRIQEIEIQGKAAVDIIDLGLSYVPEDRLGMGLIGNMNIAENLILKDYRKSKFRKGIFIDRKRMEEHATAVIQRFDIKASKPNGAIRVLSGGNLQKVLLGREILEEPKVLIAAYPVRGLDVATTEAVYHLLLEQRNRGCAILFISEDLDEIMDLSDRIIVMEGGRVAGSAKPEETTIEEIGKMMLNGKVS
ncbi:simple sugar transport system ATP-binding protein [Anaerosolibacter carboniphilus]|uniref:Simple sugar transport system ATP-binding protein n=1 Tax=Anaerosolibacter carboniphilus TaxID=1417629 RepID=A0A841KUS4_9FIRM|nr:ABC transporter ATP-binding protein [Anaerosolibacter carboniphilus]MBB6217201.1 simple sugar transport system ATP-binding protein [Anaerosolibacter carboniphilus]